MSHSLLNQVFPPSPTFLPKNLPSLTGKVFIVTGSASGVGFELAKILYAAGGTVYIGGRSTARCSEAIDKIKTAVAAEKKSRRSKESKTGGVLGSFVADLADLSTVKIATERFMRDETRLDGLIHNAGVMMPPQGSKDVQGNDLEIGIHCLAPYLLTQLLEPVLARTAASAPPFSVRVVFVVSMMNTHSFEGGMAFTRDGVPEVLPTKGMNNYMQSKVGESWVAAEFAKRLGDKKILSVSLHPGLMRTELQRHMPSVVRIMMGIAFKPAIYGAYSELYAALSPEPKEENNGGYLLAWGRIGKMQEDIAKGLKSKAEGGTGTAARFIEYCDRQTKSFL